MPKSGAISTSVRARALAWSKPRGARSADLSAAAAEQEDGPQDDGSTMPTRLPFLRRRVVPANPPPLSPQAAEVEGVDVHPASASSIVDTCRQLDEGLAAAFIRGDIRLLRRVWVLEAPDQHLPYRQVLEERERRGESPLCSPEEAAALLERGDRSIGALTHPWYSPGDPDPAGVKLKILRKALLVLTHIEAIFVDYASLFQHPPKRQRNPAEDEAFKRALGVMGDVYASAVGTTVLQIKEIPPRPKEFDGELCLFGLKPGVNEVAVRQALRRFGGIESCDLAFESTYGVVRFTTHAAALRAMAANAFLELCGGVGTRYNEHSYDGRGKGEGGRDGDDGRGWCDPPRAFCTPRTNKAVSSLGRCCFEGGVSGELLARLSVYPRMKAELDKLPPKLISLASGKASEPVELSHSDLWRRVQQVVESIEKATFTGKGDKEVVPALYKAYVERVVTVLASTLALQSTLETVAEVPPMPSIDAPPPDALRLADGQLLLLPGADARLAKVDASERATHIFFDDSVAELTFDGHSHAAIPWRPATAEAEASLRRDLTGHLPALRALGERVQRLCDDVSRPPSDPTTRSPDDVVARLRVLGKASVEVVADAARLPVLKEAASEAGLAIRAAIDEALAVAEGPEDGKDAAQKAKSSKQQAMTRADIEAQLERLAAALFEPLKSLRESLERLSPEAHFVAAWRECGFVGARRFASRQRLVVRTTDGVWREAAAEEACTLDGGPASLHPWNHAPLEVSLDAFESLRAWHTTALRAQHSHIVDALSGRRLDALEQCVAIEVAGGGVELASVVDARSLAAWLRTLHQERLAGGEATRPPATLLTAGPASGKTTLLSQVVALSLDSELVPILIKVQLLQQRLISSPDAFATAWNWVDAYLRVEHNETSPLYRMLRQAMMARRALLLLDGLDEGGTNREQIERHVVEVLAPQGHVLLATSRPAGIDESRFASFHRLRLSPLTPEQQEQALVQRVGDGRSAPLLDYVRERVPIDTETGLRVTANPLMLSMFTSVFELRTGLPMPSSRAELYKVASDVMLSRSGAASGELRRLLQYIFFEAQVSQRRVIEDRQLDEAALGLELPKALKAIRQRSGDPARRETFAAEVRTACGHLPAAMRDALAEVRRRVARDELPLLSLLQAEPLQLQSSHLSFQEYFAARALCEKGILSGAPPWQWQVSWANTLALGAEMGEPFAKGLKRAAGLRGDSLYLCGKLGGDRPTALRAVMLLSTVLTKLDLDGHELDLPKLRGTDPVTSLGLSGKGLGPASATVIASLIKGNAVLTNLDLSRNNIGGATYYDYVVGEQKPEDESGVLAIAKALEVNEALTELDLTDNGIRDQGARAIGEALKVNEVMTNLNLRGNKIGPDGGCAIGEALNANAVLTTLVIAENNIGPEGGVAIGKALEVNEMLKTLKLWDNKIGAVGATAIASALQVNPVLQSLNLAWNGIGPGATAIADSLKRNAVLRSLDLQNNSIDVEGAKAIAESLQSNEVLTNLNLRNNWIRNEGAAAIAEALRNNAALNKIVLLGNGFSEEGKEAIHDAVSGREAFALLM